MYFISTRDNKIRQTLSEAICKGLASDGGLFVPEQMPRVDFTTFDGEISFSLLIRKTLESFFVNDPLESKLQNIIEKTFSFDIPLTEVNDNTFMLELFHGPTSSFKDVGARFLAACLNYIPQENKTTTIMVATSGDTGSAVASAFYLQPNTNVIILYPKGQISQRQEHQITCWDNNILALAVDGSFDDCQRLVKAAFQHPWWQQHMNLNSANSINIGRLLPQIIFYAYSSLQFSKRHHAAPGYIIPTGNLGNAVAAYWAKEMGFPIREIVLATNANKTIPDYLNTGSYAARPSIVTLANAMDVGNPSNFERLQYLFNDVARFKKEVSAVSVDDDAIKKIINACYKAHNLIICPHTATAFFTRQQLSADPWIVVATADAGKFNHTIENIISANVPVPASLQTMLAKETAKVDVVSTLDDIRRLVQLKKWEFNNAS